MGLITQAIRALLFLSKGNKERFNYYKNNYDPRDIIMEGEEEAGSLGHWFQVPFPELENYTPKNENDCSNQGDDRPF